jgi:hypothetical protein
MRFLASFPHASWDWYHYRARKVIEGVIEGSNEVFKGESKGKVVLFESKDNIKDTEVLEIINTPQCYGLEYVAGEGLYVTMGQSCAEDCDISKEKVIRINESGHKDLEISLPVFSHLHSVKRTNNGLLITSSGIDAIFEIGLDGSIIWDWWAVEQGYNILKNGEERVIERDVDHRTRSYPTMFQTTHVNQAIEDPHLEDKILAILYHQNSIIRIDKKTKRHEVVMEGLKRPHHLCGREEGYMFTNTRESKVILTDIDFSSMEKFGGRLSEYILSNWVQDTVFTPRGTYLLSDEGNFRFIETDGIKRHNVFEYGKPDRMFEILIVPDDYRIGYNGDPL